MNWDITDAVPIHPDGDCDCARISSNEAGLGLVFCLKHWGSVRELFSELGIPEEALMAMEEGRPGDAERILEEWRP